MRVTVSLAIGLLLQFPIAKPAEASTPILDGNTLYEWCTGKEAAWKLYCDAYIRGIFEEMFLTATLRSSDPAFMCVRQTVNWKQVNDIVLTYLRNHPADRDGFAWLLTKTALLEAFPECAE